MLDKLRAEHAWDYLGEEGRNIKEILAGVDLHDEWAALEAWAAHLSRALRFPFEAKVAQFQERGPLQVGDKVIVQGIAYVVDLYGVLVTVKHKGRAYHFPLCDLEAADKGSSHHDFVREYALWFANR